MCCGVGYTDKVWKEGGYGNRRVVIQYPESPGENDRKIEEDIKEMMESLLMQKINQILYEEGEH